MNFLEKADSGEMDFDDEKLDRAKARMQALLDTSVSSEKPEDTSDPDGKKSANYLIHEFKVIDLSKVDVEELRKAVKEEMLGPDYKAPGKAYGWGR